ncbi:uncharacterized protein BDR25DRAFT_370402 [Lindgomyces ingoldianus]|uniref:Uncharacterized protein n=1 Tax=Lindgomyces ingoldianus TaxID=673940 RepID=A0ACB6QTB7_9PLEO|nr:uncharacterized protein BDR25DRAFT_370402 [Lindgomyces ingoldianus]KAF2469765.1 hypothetical protein BDR25DRAFT_370402 [Lindgomyces ingoldianus]
MSSINHLSILRQQMQIAWNEATRNGCQGKDIIPEEMRDHFQDLRELKDMKSYVQECEEREKKLQEENEDLKKQLEAAKKAVEDLPSDHNQLKVDYLQEARRVEFYKGLMEDAEGRAESYRKKLQEVTQKQLAAEQKDRRMERLEQENNQLRDCVTKLRDQLHDDSSNLEALQAEVSKALEEKDAEIATVARAAAEREQAAKAIEEESDSFQQVYNELITRMEDANIDSAQALNRMANRMRSIEKSQIAALTEAKILTHYYDRCFQILLVYRRIFQQLFNPDDQQVVWLPDPLFDALNSADKECEQYEVIHEAFEVEGLQHNEVREQLAGLGSSAKKLQVSLRAIAEDVTAFLNALEQKPDFFSGLRNKLGLPFAPFPK